jgi:cation:H+ antiporter
MITPIIQILIGFVALAAGGEMLVRGASRLAQRAGVSSLVIGLTVVAFGTSAPELAVTINAGLLGQADIAVGNVVGSNIFNLLFILGISALLAPLVVSQQLIRRDVPIMIVTAFLTLLLGWDGRISRLEGLALFAGMLTYTIAAIWAGRLQDDNRAMPTEPIDGDRAGRPKWRKVGLLLLLIVAGLVVLVVGARVLVDGAVSIARVLGMSELLIGLTIVAAGTSLPEVAASVIATLRGERDIAIGNVVGSCIFNVLSVLGLGAAVSPDGLQVSQSALSFDIPVMVAISVACLPIVFSSRLIARWEGGLLFFFYLLYTTYLILRETQPAASEKLATIVLWGIVPGAILLLAVHTALSVFASDHFESEIEER